MDIKNLTKEQQVRLNYINACNAYVDLFCEKHKLHYNKNDWVGGFFGAGDIICINDYWLSMEDIKTDIDFNAPKDGFIEWYDYNTVLYQLDYKLPCMSYENWLKGLKPLLTKEEIKEMFQYNGYENSSEVAERHTELKTKAWRRLYKKGK